MNLPSKFQIDDKVVFGANKSNGTIVAVRFTKAKVLYDILDDYWGHIMQDIDSLHVGSITPEYTPEEIRSFNSLN